MFHLHASNGVNNLIYDHVFGVEGALPAVFADLVICGIILILASKKGRLKELTMRRPKAMEMQGLTIPAAQPR